MRPEARTMPLPGLSEAVEVRDSAVHGRGVFARDGLARHHVVGIYEGRRYTAAQARRRRWDHGLTYVFGLSDGTVIDGALGGNGTRHLNHRCRPNCEAVEVRRADGGLDIVIRTTRRVAAGRELFIDYALDVDDPGAPEYRCRCGARGCRGTMAAMPATR